jgi:titin
VISGNQYGMSITNASSNTVQGNFMGTDPTGTVALGNLTHAININTNASGNIVGGTTAGTANVISGNQNGILLLTGANGNFVQGNFIGTNSAGAAAIANGNGIHVDGAPSNTIGGTAVGAGNVIAGNTFHGISIQNAAATGNLIQGNFIGTNQTGVAIANGTGIRIQNAPNNTIGGTAAGARNTIAFNGGVGVILSGTAATGNAILGNSIGNNGGLGIDLDSNGVTANDVGDADTGPNNLQNFPVVTSAESSLSTVTFTLNSTPNTTFTVQVFSNSLCDASGNGEGRLILASVPATTDGSGNVTLAVSATPLNVGEAVTATATDPSGNTSEFSACKTVTP